MNLAYRDFAHIGMGKVPDAKTLARIAQALGGEVIAELHRRLVEIAQQEGVIRGRKLRVDTTVVLGDGFPAVPNILEEHHERPTIPKNPDQAAGTRTVESDLDDGTRGNGNGDSLAIDRIDAKRLGLQSKNHFNPSCAVEFQQCLFVGTDVRCGDCQGAIRLNQDDGEVARTAIMILRSDR
jgi:hypothetical protein